MHYHRIEVTGPAPAVTTVVAELVRRGARPVAAPTTPTLVLVTVEPVTWWDPLTARHRAVSLGVETFAAFADELAHLHVAGGRTTVMRRAPVLDDRCGSVHDVDGEALDPVLLRAAAASVAACRDRRPAGGLSSGLDTALTVARALGGLAGPAADALWEEPTPAVLEAVRELAVVALGVCGCGHPACRVEQEFLHALALTRAVLHAGESEWADRPGAAFWEEWLSALLGQATWVIEAGCDAMLRPDSELTALGAEHYGTAEEVLESAGAGLLTTCLETLALFDAELAPGRP